MGKHWCGLNQNHQALVIDHLIKEARLLGDEAEDQRDRARCEDSPMLKGDLLKSAAALEKNKRAFELSIVVLNLARNRAPDGAPLSPVDEHLIAAAAEVRADQRNKSRRWSVATVPLADLSQTLNGFSQDGYTIYSIRTWESCDRMTTVVAFQGK